jgi:ketosteroid isomerase-like protein
MDVFNRRDVAALLDLISPDVEWVPLRAVLDGDVYRGHDGIRRFIADMDEDIEGMQVRSDEVFEVGENVVVYGAIVGKGRGSGMDLDLPIGWVMHVTEGRVDYLRAYSERADALEAAERAREGVELPLGPPAPALDS